MLSRFQKRSRGDPPSKFWSTFGATWLIWGPILTQLDFEGLPKSIIFVQDQHNSFFNLQPGAVPEKT